MPDGEEASSSTRRRSRSEGDETMVRFRRWIAKASDTKWREYRGTAEAEDIKGPENVVELVDSMMLARMCHFGQMMGGWQLMRGGLTNDNAKCIYDEMIKSLASLQQFELQNFSTQNSWATPQEQSAFPNYLSDLPVRDGGTVSAIMSDQSHSTPVVVRLVAPDSEDVDPAEFLRLVFGDFVPEKLLKMFREARAGNRVEQIPDGASSATHVRTQPASEELVETPILRSSSRSRQSLPDLGRRRSYSNEGGERREQNPTPNVPRRLCSGIGYTHSPDWRLGTRVTILNPSGPSPEEEPLLFDQAPLVNLNVPQYPPPLPVPPLPVVPPVQVPLTTGPILNQPMNVPPFQGPQGAASIPIHPTNVPQIPPPLPVVPPVQVPLTTGPILNQPMNVPPFQGPQGAASIPIHPTNVPQIPPPLPVVPPVQVPLTTGPILNQPMNVPPFQGPQGAASIPIHPTNVPQIPPPLPVVPPVQAPLTTGPILEQPMIVPSFQGPQGAAPIPIHPTNVPQIPPPLPVVPPVQVPRATGPILEQPMNIPPFQGPQGAAPIPIHSTNVPPPPPFLPPPPGLNQVPVPALAPPQLMNIPTAPYIPQPPPGLQGNFPVAGPGSELMVHGDPGNAPFYPPPPPNGMPQLMPPMAPSQILQPGPVSGGNWPMGSSQVLALLVVQRPTGEMINMGFTPVNCNALLNQSLMNGAGATFYFQPPPPPHRQPRGNHHRGPRRPQNRPRTDPVRSQPSTPASGSGPSTTPQNDSGFSSTSEQEPASTRGSTPAPAPVVTQVEAVTEEVTETATEVEDVRPVSSSEVAGAEVDEQIHQEEERKEEVVPEEEQAAVVVEPPKLVLSYASIVSRGVETTKTDRHTTTTSSSSSSSTPLTSSTIVVNTSSLVTETEIKTQSERLAESQESSSSQSSLSLKNDEDDEWTVVRNKHPVLSNQFLVLVIPEPTRNRADNVAEVVELSDDEVEVDEEKERAKEKRQEQRRNQRAAKVRKHNEEKKAEEEERARQLALENEARALKEQQEQREQREEEQPGGTPALLQGGHLGSTYSPNREEELRRARDEERAEEVLLNSHGQRKYQDSDVITEEIEEDDPTQPREVLHIESRDHAKLMFRLLWFDNKKKLHRLYCDEPTRQRLQGLLDMIRIMKDRVDMAGRMIVYRVGRPQISDHIEENIVSVARNLIDVTRHTLDGDMQMARTVCELVGRRTKNFTYQNYVFCILSLTEDFLPLLGNDDRRGLAYREIITLAHLHIARVAKIYEQIAELYEFRINLVPKRRPRR